MINLKYTEIEIIRPLVAERIEGSRIGDRLSLDHTMTLISMNSISRGAEVYVDRKENPQAVLVLRYAKASVCEETTVIMNLIYVSNDIRENNARLAIELTNEMFATAEAYAVGKKADVIQAASWVYRGSPDISHLLERKGFEPQTREFVKILTPNHPKQ